MKVTLTSSLTTSPVFTSLIISFLAFSTAFAGFLAGFFSTFWLEAFGAEAFCTFGADFLLSSFRFLTEKLEI